jgi:hypothetical protein
VQVVMSPRIVLPERVSLAALGEEWTVEYRETGGRFVAAGARPGRRLLVSGCTGDLELCRLALRRWLLRMGGEYLPPWLESLAVSRGFRFERAAVRLQRTRWGSYSRRGTVSLNARLLLLPPELTQYVMIHELCHSIHLDHSSRFWSLVRHHDPHCDRHRREIRAAGRQMPAWTR